ncbi:hypothetical protein ABT158_50280 [Nonomuraea sp. NPDC001636]
MAHALLESAVGRTDALCRLGRQLLLQIAKLSQEDGAALALRLNIP